MAVDFTQEIKELRTTMDSVRGVTDLDTLGKTIADLEQQAAAPDLWDDPEKAQQVTSALSRANSERDRVTGMAVAQAVLVHRGVTYDVQVDTTHTEALDCARAIAALVH